ncbi:spore germination protein [Bacillus sp. 2205SS5-2]|uniref:spore germination protein n=1 Tax=Bacillus sp. 2205SS5-2 TaxID=3109031 RepID=UPI0030058311
MPGFVGIIQVVSVGSSGVVHVGDIFQLQPNAVAKTFSGAGSFNTGNGLSVYNEISNTNVNDSDGVDQPITFTL